MVILGLGSNLGDRLSHCRHALSFLKNLEGLQVLQVSPVYVSDALMPENAPPEWNIPYYNLALRCDTSLAPHELLSQIKAIEVKVGREPNKKWGPRIIDIDLLAWDSLVLYDEKLHIPHEGLLERPFALWPLADIAPRWTYPLPGAHKGQTAAELTEVWGSRFTGSAPFHTKQIQSRIDTPELVGILNLTPDSFSDGVVSYTVDALIQQAHDLIEAGATILDLGAEATGPKATPLTAEEEWSRLATLLPDFMQAMKTIPGIKISIDTRHPETALKTLPLGVNWINDVGGLTNPDMRKVLADADCDIVAMHNLGVPVSQSRSLDPKNEAFSPVLIWAENQLNVCENDGISRERIIFDVGIGYGKTPEHSLELIHKIDLFKSLNTRLLVGHSRKSFLQRFTAQPAAERDLETTLFSIHLASKGVDYLRVHNVDHHARAFKIARAFSPCF